MHRTVAAAFVLLVLVWSAVTAAAAAAADATPTAVTVDAAHPAGTTNQDLVGFAFDPRVDGPGFQPLRSRTFRFDVGFQDLVACPGTSFRADRLAALQAKLDEIDALGADAILILTYMPPCLADTGPPGDPRDPTRLPPRDPAVWRSVVRALVTAVGPDRARAGKRPVRYFEVWNEPDWFFYEGSQAEFVTNIEVPAGQAVADVARQSGLALRFGVCGCLFADPSWLIPLMDAARTNGVPVGFVSWHYYGNYPFIGPDGVEPAFPKASSPIVGLIGQRNPATTPQDYVVQIDQVRQWATAALGHVPEQVVDEWNLSAGGFDRRMDTNEGAAFQVATLAAMASDHLDRAALFSAVDPYDRDIDGNPLPTRYGGWGVVDRSLARKPAWYGMWLWEHLGAVRLSSAQDPVGGVFTAAARDGDAASTRVDVVVASFVATGGSDRALALTVQGVAAGRWDADVYRVDAAHAGSTAPTERVAVDVGGNGVVHVATALPAQSVVLVELTRAAAAPSPGSTASSATARGRQHALPATGGGPPVGWALAALALSLSLVLPVRKWVLWPPLLDGK